MSNRVSVWVCVSVLVVSPNAGKLLTPLTPCKTRLNARDHGPKHDWGTEVREERFSGCIGWEEDAFHRKAEIKARQDAKHSKTERLQTIVFVQYCLFPNTIS